MMLCIDCLVEDHDEVEAITVTNGFALCNNHLFSFYAKVHKSQKKQVDQLGNYLDWEAASSDRSDAPSS